MFCSLQGTDLEPIFGKFETIGRDIIKSSDALIFTCREIKLQPV